jgi:hypothetical protein
LPRIALSMRSTPRATALEAVPFLAVGVQCNGWRGAFTGQHYVLNHSMTWLDSQPLDFDRLSGNSRDVGATATREHRETARHPPTNPFLSPRPRSPACVAH